MKKKGFALAAAFVLALVLTGCSADRETNTLEPSHSVYDPDGARSSDRVGGIDDGNDAFEGGGAGGTNDRDNDGRPDGGIGSDLGDAVDDIGRGAGDAIRDAGDAVGDAVDDIDRDMH